MPTMATAMPVKMPCATPTDRIPYTLATIVSEMLLNSRRACSGDSGITPSARCIQSRPSLKRKNTTTSAINDLAIRPRDSCRGSMPRTQASRLPPAVRGK